MSVRTCSLSTLPIAARGRVSPVAAVAAVPTLPEGWILIARRNQRVAPLRRPSRMQSDPALKLQRSAALVAPLQRFVLHPALCLQPTANRCRHDVHPPRHLPRRHRGVLSAQKLDSVMKQSDFVCRFSNQCAPTNRKRTRVHSHPLHICSGTGLTPPTSARARAISEMPHLLLF